LFSFRHIFFCFVSGVIAACHFVPFLHADEQHTGAFRTFHVPQQEKTESWQSSGILYLDGHVSGEFLLDSLPWIEKCRQEDSPHHGSLQMTTPGTLDAFSLPDVREVARQSFLLEAYYQLGLVPRDEWLSDAFPQLHADSPGDASPSSTKTIASVRLDFHETPELCADSKYYHVHVVSLWATDEKDCREKDVAVDYKNIDLSSLKKTPDDHLIPPATTRQTGIQLVQEPLTVKNYFMIDSTQNIQRLLRERFLPAIRSRIATVSPLPQGTTTIPKETEELLKEMNMFSQYRAIREIDALEQKTGWSPQTRGALARAYTNLAFLTSHLFHPCYHIFAGRAIWYAENLPETGSVTLTQNGRNVTIPASLWRNWNRVYVWGFLGYHTDAIECMQAVQEQCKQDAALPETPAWVKLVEKYYHYDLFALKNGLRDQEWKTLAAVLLFKVFDEGNATGEQEMGCDIGTLAGAKLFCCDRLYASKQLGDLPNINARGTKPVQEIDEYLSGEFSKMPGLPKNVKALTKTSSHFSGGVMELFGFGSSPKAGNNDDDSPASAFQKRRGIWKALMNTEPVMANPSECYDPIPLSWASLGMMLRETSYVQAINIVLIPVAYGVSTEETLDETRPLYEGHPYELLLDFYSTDMNNQQNAQQAFNQLYPPENIFNNRPLSSIPRLYREIEYRNQKPVFMFPGFFTVCEANHTYDSLGLASDFGSRKWMNSPSGYVCQLWLQRSPYQPIARAGLIIAEWDAIKDLVDVWAKEASGFPPFQIILGKKYFKDNDFDKAEACFENASSFYRSEKPMLQLADLYWKKGEHDHWLATMKKAMSHVAPGLALSLIHFDISEKLQELKRYDEALPFAEQAAQAGSARGFLTLARCFENLGRLDEAEEYYRSNSQRYNNGGYYWLLFCLRNNRPYPDEAKTLFDGAVHLAEYGQVYNFSLEPWYFKNDEKKLLENLNENYSQEQASWNGFMLAMIYDKNGNMAQRDKLLSEVAEGKSHDSEEFRYGLLPAIAKMIVGDLASGGKCNLPKEELKKWFDGCPDAKEMLQGQFLLGMYYFNRNQKELAIPLWQACMKSHLADHPRRTEAAIMLRKCGVDPNKK